MRRAVIAVARVAAYLLAGWLLLILAAAAALIAQGHQ